MIVSYFNSFMALVCVYFDKKNYLLKLEIFPAVCPVAILTKHIDSLSFPWLLFGFLLIILPILTEKDCGKHQIVFFSILYLYFISSNYVDVTILTNWVVYFHQGLNKN